MGPTDKTVRWHFSKILWLLLSCFSSVQFSSISQSCPTLWDPMNHSTSGLPVHHQLLESTQTLIHQMGNAIQPSHPLSSPSPPVLNLSQDQGLFKWVSSSHQVAKVLEFQLKHQSFQWTPRTPLEWTCWISLLSKGLSRVFSKIFSKISFRMDLLDLLAVQGTLKSLLQHHSSKASILQRSAFFTVQFSHPSIHDYWKNHSLD